MLHPFGCPVTPEDAFPIVDLLHSHGRAVDLEVATTIKSGLQHGLVAIALNEAERDAVLAALVEPPYPGAELRGELAATIATGQPRADFG